MNINMVGALLHASVPIFAYCHVFLVQAITSTQPHRLSYGTHTHRLTHKHICTYTSTYTGTHIYICFIHTKTHIHLHGHTCSCAHTSIHTYTCRDTCVHVHAHTHTHFTFIPSATHLPFWGQGKLPELIGTCLEGWRTRRSNRHSFERTL